MTSGKEKLFSVTAKDCEWEYYRGSGAGGQKRNKTSSAVRCRHKPSGAVGQSQDERNQKVNKRLAFKRMAATKEFKSWLKIEVARITGAHSEAERYADREIRSDRIVVEVKKDGRWVDDDDVESDEKE